MFAPGLTRESCKVAKRFAVHPFIIALFPVLFLYDRNAGHFPLGAVVRPAVISLGMAIAMWLVLLAISRNAKKAALAASLFLALFFSYGHLVNLAGGAGFSVAGARVALSHLFIPVMAAMFLVGAYFAVRTRRDLSNITAVLNYASLCLVALPTSSIVTHEIKAAFAPTYDARELDEGAAEIPTKSPSPPPNIYYIILDGYGRGDRLKEFYGFDNSPFIGALESRGFRVAARGRTNYSQTMHSLASSLNMAYLDGMAAKVGADCKDRTPIYELVRHSRVRKFLAARGYRFVSFATGFHPTEILDADVYVISPEQLSEFDTGFLDLTPAVTDEAKAAKDRARILFPFERLPLTARLGFPVFVFAHVVAPHPPFVFAADGGPAPIEKYYSMASGSDLIGPDGITRAQYISLYTGQMAFINKKVIELVDAILADSKTPPIIIFQGDHGPGAFQQQENAENTCLEDRMSILNAYYLPSSGGAPPIYDSITPVNTFRVIFNSYFGTSLTPLPDESFFVTWTRPYKLVNVTNEIGTPADMERFERLKDRDYFDSPARPPAR